jgi:methionyl-tRNA synthetase
MTGPKNTAITSKRKIANEKLSIKSDCSKYARHQKPWQGAHRKANKKTEATMGIAKQ